MGFGQKTNARLKQAFELLGLVVPALLLTPIGEVVHTRPIPRPMAFPSIVGLRLGFLLNGRLGGVGVEGGAFLRLRGEVVGLRVGEVGVDVFHS